jgi:hypothetical protein
VNELFARFFEVRKELGIRHNRQDIPFSSVWEIQRQKYNQQNWVENYGYYSVGMRECPSQDWQTSWVGGLNTVYALLACGDETTRRRALRTFDFLCDTGGVYEAGYLRNCFGEGRWMEDNPSHLQRFSADGLYFLIKEFMLLKDQGESEINARWEQLAKGLADAFCGTWQKWGQFGHRSNPHTGDVAWGGTAGAAIAIGGLALASVYFNEPRYLDVAQASGRYYYDEYVCKGLLNGAPGDALHAPDCESGFGLLESYITLYEVSGDQVWITYARDVAHHCASYVVSYDFAFPANSTFGKLDMLTTGTIMANVQNKCAVPGICTLSGNSLLKLFRVTGEKPYLELLRDIAHSIPQYMSRADRPIIDRRPNQRWPIMDPGWINERVNMGDWEVRGEPDEEIGVGEIFGGSCWCEAAMMLSYADLPGLYVQVDTGVVCPIDHVEVNVIGRDGGGMVLELRNPTPFDAAIKVFAETSGDLSKTLGAVSMLNCPVIKVAANAHTIAKVSNSGVTVDPF